LDFIFLLKAGFMGFSLSVGVQILIFFLMGRFIAVDAKRFNRVFIIAAVASFVAVYFFLRYKILISQIADAQLFLTGCIGGWLAGLLFGGTQLKRFLLGLGK
jgi:hypothetical protein